MFKYVVSAMMVMGSAAYATDHGAAPAAPATTPAATEAPMGDAAMPAATDAKAAKAAKKGTAAKKAAKTEKKEEGHGH